ncbi:Uncharacterised protein [Chlamydia trachomatis]|nr:Uncharacterised protein [Chlamydia trachomatis]
MFRFCVSETSGKGAFAELLLPFKAYKTAVFSPLKEKS